MCDTLVCLTSSGVLFAKNSDRDPNEAQTLRWFPGQSHDVGADLRCTFSTISQVEHTHAVVLSQPWWMWGAEMGANEHGLVIGNEAVFSRGAPRSSTGSELLGMDLVRLALERARTAEEAAGVIVGCSRPTDRAGRAAGSTRVSPTTTLPHRRPVRGPRARDRRAGVGERASGGRGRSISNVQIELYYPPYTTYLR